MTKVSASKGRVKKILNALKILKFQILKVHVNFIFQVLLYIG